MTLGTEKLRPTTYWGFSHRPKAVGRSRRENVGSCSKVRGLTLHYAVLSDEDWPPHSLIIRITDGCVLGCNHQTIQSSGPMEMRVGQGCSAGGVLADALTAFFRSVDGECSLDALHGS
jgi:hypothetical protein